ncbi:MAG TPA: aldehyde dehydrogenase family protein [Halobacteriales archaeon]|nr:aldehyde dehydrogenase family protein [Halobacteriales archaeon]
MSSGVEESGVEESDEGHIVVSRNPATLEVNDEVPEATPADVAEAVADAAAAQPGWAARPIEERLAVIRRFQELLLARKEEVAETVSAETGKPLGEAIATELSPVLNAVAFASDEAPGILEESIPLGGFSSTGKSTIVREPLGVVGMITPWNYPFGIPGSEVVPTLLAGNAVVLKPAEETTLTGLLLRALLHEAGLPQDLFAVVPGRGRVTGQALVDADIDFLSFTGSAEVGYELDEACERRGIPTCLELGGSDPAIVLADANLDLAADGILWARFSNAGQSCAAVKRLYVEASVEPELRELLVERVEALRVGGSGDTSYEVGPLVGEGAVEKLHDQVERSVEMGAEVLTGGGPVDGADGHFYAPTVLTNVSDDMPVVTEETFGPVLPIVPVADEAEALERANDTRFGLTGSVWTRDTDRGERVARRIEAGTVTVNEHLYTFGLHATPWGGYKDSGGDLSHGRWILEDVTRPKHVHVAPGDASLSSGRFKDLWWFPYADDYPSVVSDTMDLLYGSGVGTRLRAAPTVLRTLFGNGDR